MLIRKLFRTAWKYKAQFISMIIMVAIGMGVFVGFNMEWYSLERDTSDFLQTTAYADYRIYNEQGFSESDIEAIKNIDGVKEASRTLSVNVDVKDSETSLALFLTEDYSVSKTYLVEGEEYDGSDGFWLSDKFAAANGISAGDTLTVTYRTQISGEVKGLVKSGEFMICVADENQLMPDYSVFGFVYASPTFLNIDFYPQINIISDLEKTELETAVTQALKKTTLVLSKEEHTAYAAALSEIEEGQSMGAILPVLFLLIGVLTMITTMHRITSNEKTQIGTLKALGFKDRRILGHYTSYGFVIGLIGCILGVGLGFGIAYFVVNPYGMQGTYFDMPFWKLYVPYFCWIALAATVAFLTLIGFLSVKKMLKGSAADALRPYTPKKVKPLAVEKTRVWNKLSFSAKWNLRDVFRHKSRSLMTLIGVIGCMILLVGGLGMRDTMVGFLDLIDSKLYNYETRVNIETTASNEEVLSFAQSIDGDWVAASSVNLDGNAVSLEIYDVAHDLLRFVDKKNNFVNIQSDGAYICIRLSDKYSVGDYITVSPYGSEESYTVKVAGVIRSVMTENIVITREYAESLGIPYRISSVYTDLSSDNIPNESFISGKQTQKSIMQTYDSFMEIMNVMVLVFIVAAIVLGVVVLYNLGVMSYVERYRELATLKVVGFKDKRISAILISQNIWLTVLGVLIGLPSGIGVLNLLIVTLASEYELKTVVGALTYCVSVALTFGVSLIVGLFVARKNKKIDMVEALKGAE